MQLNEEDIGNWLITANNTNESQVPQLIQKAWDALQEDVKKEAAANFLVLFASSPQHFPLKKRPFSTPDYVTPSPQTPPEVPPEAPTKSTRSRPPKGKGPVAKRGRGRPRKMVLDSPSPQKKVETTTSASAIQTQPQVPSAQVLIAEETLDCIVD